jgi:hypothetical protein
VIPIRPAVAVVVAVCNNAHRASSGIAIPRQYRDMMLSLARAAPRCAAKSVELSWNALKRIPRSTRIAARDQHDLAAHRRVRRWMS